MSILYENKTNVVLVVFLFIIQISTVNCDDNPLDQKNYTCEKIHGNEFPEDLFTTQQRKYGAIILHIILFIYAFGAIEIVCKEYFLPCIKCICEDLKLSDDVAAATFMSIATSSPELFTNIIGTFITESDIGLGHVIGNGYYDMFFVAAIGGIAASQDIVLEWWPLARDCFIYFIVATTLTGIVWDGIVQTYETLILFVMYIIYIFIMFNNEKIRDEITKKLNIKTDQTQNSQNKTLFAEDEEKMTQKQHEVKEQELSDSDTNALPSPLVQPPVTIKKNKFKKFLKIVFTLPLGTMMRYTIPDVRISTKRKYYPITFLLCIAWIGVTTYLGTWMISVIGETIGISDIIMGMIFMAAGGSVVEAYSVYYKAKRGECSIGLSNSMGCNTLDATLCLALPWFIKTIMPIYKLGCATSSSAITLESSLTHYTCLLLVISVAVLFGIFYFNKFKFNKKSGTICLAVYVIVIIIAIKIES